MAALFDYLAGLWHNWVWFMTGGPFVAERIAKQIWPEYDVWIARFITQKLRQRLTVGAAISGIFVASFLAFSDERSQLNSARQVLDRVSEKRLRTYQPLTRDQEETLLRRVNPLLMKGYEQVGFYSVDNPSSVALAEHLRSLFKAQGIKTYFMSNLANTPDESGIAIQIRHPEHPTVRDQSFIDAFRLSGITVSVQDLQSTDDFPDSIPFAVNISYPPL